MKHMTRPAPKSLFTPSVLRLLTASFLLLPGAKAATLTWDNGGAAPSNPADGFSSVWNVSSSVWSNGSSDSAWVNANNDIAVFGHNNGTAGSVALGDNITVGGLTFNAATSGSYTLAPGSGPYTLTLAGTTPTITANVDAGISAVIAGTNGLTKSGTGTLTLSGANTYTGVTTINGGTLDIKTWVNGGLPSSVGASTTGTTASPNLIINGGTLKFTGTSAQASTRIIGIGTSGATLDASGTANGFTLGISAASFGYVGSGARTLTLAGSLGGIQSNGGSLSAVIADGSGGATSLVKNGTGSWSLGAASTYTGSTTINAGVLFLTAGANRLPTTTTLAVDTAGTFNLQGQNQTVAALTNGANGGGTIVNNAGTTNTFTVGSGAFSGTLKDKAIGSSSKLALTKIGNGTLTLSGANTYTGATTINAGTLALGANNVFAASNFIFNGGTLAVGTFTNSAVGTLALTGNSAISLGAGGSFVFADSHLLDWGSFTLSISGTFVDGSSIRFGSGASALTSAQLALISINGAEAALNSSGYLVAAIPEPSTYAAFFGALVLTGAAVHRRRAAARTGSL